MSTLQVQEALLSECMPSTSNRKVVYGSFTLSGPLFRGICTYRCVGDTSKDYNSDEGTDFHHGLALLHSPLLKGSF